MSSMEIALVAIVAILAAVLAVAGWYLWRHQALQRRFGPEYRRLMKEQGPIAAERELRGRERRHATLELKPLDEQSREHYATAWRDVQARFVDSPEDAIGAADELLTRLIAERGYPTGDYDEEMAQLSVDHARALDRYRAAHDIYQRQQRGEATTEDLRQAFVHYRALFAELLEQDPVATGATTDTDDMTDTEATADTEATTDTEAMTDTQSRSEEAATHG